MYDGLGAFVEALEREGELVRIAREVDPFLEIGTIADRTMKGGGPALLFERPKGSRFPLLINAFGSRARMSLALGVRDLEADHGRGPVLGPLALPCSVSEESRSQMPKCLPTASINISNLWGVNRIRISKIKIVLTIDVPIASAALVRNRLSTTLGRKTAMAPNHTTPDTPARMPPIMTTITTANDIAIPPSSKRGQGNTTFAGLKDHPSSRQLAR